MSSARVQSLDSDGEPNPELVVGIDLGTTFTGVSYCIPRPGVLDPPSIINKWPEYGGVANKVPTMISTGFGQDVSWGYGASNRRGARGHVIEDHFKLLLDPKQLSRLNADIKHDHQDAEPIEMTQIRNWFEIYLKNMYEWIRAQLEDPQNEVIGGRVLDEMRVDFLFSVPTTWKQEVKKDYLKIIRRAGFGSARLHKSSISLNEAEAAAAFIALCHPKEAKNEFKRDDVIILCDAGGSTTDVSALKIADIQNKVLQFVQQRRVKGIPIGSANIDEIFEQEIRALLGKLGCVAGAASSGQFQEVKARLGNRNADNLPDFTIQIPGLGRGITNIEAGVSDGNVTVRRQQIEDIFDTLLEGDLDKNAGNDSESDSDEEPDSTNSDHASSSGIYGLIDKQISKIIKNTPNKRVDCLILSGELGSSKYVQRRLIERYGHGSVWQKEGIEILIADQPQLAVCRGLVLNHIHKLYEMHPIIRKRVSPASYGLVWNEPYDPQIHSHLKSERTKLKPDRRYYLPNRIHWFIEQNQLLDCDRLLAFHFSRSLHYQHPDRLSHQIVRFDGPLRRLPNKFTQLPSLRSVCTVSCRLKSPSELLDQNARGVRIEHGIRLPLVSRGFRKYVRVDYEIHVTVHDSGLRFNIWFDGENRDAVAEAGANWTAELMGLEALPGQTGSGNGNIFSRSDTTSSSGSSRPSANPSDGASAGGGYAASRARTSP